MHRRTFLKTAAAGTAAAFLPAAWPMPSSRLALAGRVIRTTRANVIDTNEKISSRVLRPMIEETLVALTNTGSIRDAWEALLPDLQSEDVIGFKVNMINTRGLVSHPEVVFGLTDSLVEVMGVKPNNLLIWDRTDSELEGGGYELNRTAKGVRCFGTLASRRGGSDANPAIPGYDEALTVDAGPGAGVHFSNILTQTCRYMINVPVLKDHRITGVTLAMKNLYGVINSPSSCHPNGGDPYLANLNNHPVIREKTKLIFADAIFSCYSGGPGGPAQVMNRQLMASLDPVAIDTIALEMIDAERERRKMALAAERAGFLGTAGRMGVGVSRRDAIDLVDA